MYKIVSVCCRASVKKGSVWKLPDGCGMGWNSLVLPMLLDTSDWEFTISNELLTFNTSIL
jgi:hypothetical protein